MKKTISLILALILLFSISACGKPGDSKVDVYLPVMDVEGAGAKVYVEELQAANPDNVYKYYNEKFYIQTMTEEERKAALERIADPSPFFIEAAVDEFAGLFTKAEMNKNGDELTLYVDRAVYDGNFLAGIYVTLFGASYISVYQAYSLVPIEDRGGRLICMDENGEVLIDTDEIEAGNVNG